MTITEIEAFCRANNVSEARFGLDALGERAFMYSLRKGRQLRPTTIAKIETYMTNFIGEATAMSALDRFAEEISKDCTDPKCADPACGREPVGVKLAAQRAGISYDQGNAYMQRLRKMYDRPLKLAPYAGSVRS